MKILLITGNHPRHLYLKNILIRAGILGALITEKRENFIPSPPPGLDEVTVTNFTRHFQKREEAEKHFFETTDTFFNNSLSIHPEELNDKSTIEFVAQYSPDLVITAGSGFLRKDFLRALPGEIWNIHGGLSPWYKGAITHFWPSYHLQPQFTGCTIHHVSSKLDGGEIIHHSPAVLESGDGLHYLASRSLKLAFHETVELIKGFVEGRKYTTLAQNTTGKLWLKKDWSPYHLNLIYEMYNDRIVDAFLEGKLHQATPRLHRQQL